MGAKRDQALLRDKDRELRPQQTYLAVDVGGTFTDAVVWSPGRPLRIAKAHTTPTDLSVGVINAIARSDADLEDAHYLFHGTTAVINSLIERNGASTGLVTTSGFRDVYEIARGIRHDPYDFLFRRAAPLVPRRYRFEVEERVAPSGESVTPPRLDQIAEVATRIRTAGLEAVAICLINSYANGSHEQMVAESLRQQLPDVFICLSSELAPEWREFERTSTTVMNAFVARRMAQYVLHLEDRLRQHAFRGHLFFMHSTGGSMSASAAFEAPLALVESGPASGIVGAGRLASAIGVGRAVAFDMGGTTAKAALVIEGAAQTTRPYFVRPFGEKFQREMPSLFPVVDVVEVGTGGGSIARVEDGSRLTVGPDSAGSEPGPVAYGQGGQFVTVTDANLVCGLFAADSFLGGSVRVDADAAHHAIANQIARPLGMTTMQAATGILTVANTAMALAIRQVSIERGEDPRRLTMIAFGGSGPTHAAALAGIVGIPRVLIPPAPENFSAIGMLLTETERRKTATVVNRLSEADFPRLSELIAQLEENCLSEIRSQVPESAPVNTDIVMEMRYVGQEATLRIPFDRAWTGSSFIQQSGKRFHTEHERAYGYAVEHEPIQLVSIDVVGRARLDLPRPAEICRADVATGGLAQIGAAQRNVFDGTLDRYRVVPVLSRQDLSKKPTAGPLLVQEYGSTTFVPAGAKASRDDANNIAIDVSFR